MTGVAPKIPNLRGEPLYFLTPMPVSDLGTRPGVRPVPRPEPRCPYCGRYWIARPNSCPGCGAPVSSQRYDDAPDYNVALLRNLSIPSGVIAPPPDRTDYSLLGPVWGAAANDSWLDELLAEITVPVLLVAVVTGMVALWPH